MQRIRQSLPYLMINGWTAEIIAVDPAFVEINSVDEHLTETFPAEIPVHWINAYPTEKTRKIGLGSLSMRSWIQFRKKGNGLLRSKKFDLVFFSTTAFHVMSLGPYWKRKFNVPFVLDIQDPWRNDYYLTQPKEKRPPKFRITYNIDKYLERKTVPKADGILSVSKGYIDMFHKRYPSTLNIPSLVLPFGGNKLDFDIVAKYNILSRVHLDPRKKNIVYIGRGGKDLEKTVGIFFAALQIISGTEPALYDKIHCSFIGTSYALAGKGRKTIEPIAHDYAVDHIVTEITDRLPYFESLSLLKEADMLFVPGSTDTAYTASKIYPYILAKKNLLTIFHRSSSVNEVLKKTNAGTAIMFDEESDDIDLANQCSAAIIKILLTDVPVQTNWDFFEEYTAETMTGKMLNFFSLISDKS